MIGVLTLEDIIESTLRVDITDEFDRDKAIKLLQSQTPGIQFTGAGSNVEMKQLEPYLQIKYKDTKDFST